MVGPSRRRAKSRVNERRFVISTCLTTRKLQVPDFRENARLGTEINLKESGSAKSFIMMINFLIGSYNGLPASSSANQLVHIIYIYIHSISQHTLNP